MYDSIIFIIIFIFNVFLMFHFEVKYILLKYTVSQIEKGIRVQICNILEKMVHFTPTLVKKVTPLSLINGSRFYNTKIILFMKIFSTNGLPTQSYIFCFSIFGCIMRKH